MTLQMSSSLSRAFTRGKCRLGCLLGKVCARNQSLIGSISSWVITDMGGSNADLTTEQSVSGMISVFEKFTPKDNGWYGNWKGERMPW